MLSNASYGQFLLQKLRNLVLFLSFDLLFPNLISQGGGEAFLLITNTVDYLYILIYKMPDNILSTIFYWVFLFLINVWKVLTGFVFTFTFYLWWFLLYGIFRIILILKDIGLMKLEEPIITHLCYPVSHTQ